MGAAAQTGSKARRLSSRSGRVEAHVGPPGSLRGTHRAAIDPGAGHGREEHAVEAGVAAEDGAVAGFEVVVHACRVGLGSGFLLAVFGPTVSSEAAPSDDDHDLAGGAALLDESQRRSGLCQWEGRADDGTS